MSDDAFRNPPIGPEDGYFSMSFESKGIAYWYVCQKHGRTPHDGPHFDGTEPCPECRKGKP